MSYATWTDAACRRDAWILAQADAYYGGDENEEDTEQDSQAPDEPEGTEEEG